MNQDVVSFVLRFVREESDGHPARWRGVIKHVQSDQSADFAAFSDALAFMQAHVDEAIRRAFSTGEPDAAESILAETARLWGELAPRYTDLMLQSMEMMLDQGRRLSETFAENLAQWGQGAPPAAPAQQDAVLALVERLATQVDALASKVEALEARLRDA
ncbi:MAG: hypothetical protein KBH93_09305 [Anaerolineae bacterium]|nr:hypothetical protein [Anaerolineae bacterium]